MAAGSTVNRGIFPTYPCATTPVTISATLISTISTSTSAPAATAIRCSAAATATAKPVSTPSWAAGAAPAEDVARVAGLPLRQNRAGCQARGVEGPGGDRVPSGSVC